MAMAQTITHQNVGSRTEVVRLLGFYDRELFSVTLKQLKPS